MKIVNKVNGWHSLVGTFGVVVLALGVSLRLEGAEESGTKVAPVAIRQTTTSKVESLSATHLDPAATERTDTRTRAGNLPGTGYKVMNVVHVDWRDDQGTRDREAGKLFGPVPASLGGGGVVASHPRPVCGSGCSFDIECDDGNKCTTDTCSIPPGLGACAGACVHTPVEDGKEGECDDGNYCNGAETCRTGTVTGCAGGPAARCCNGPTTLCCPGDTPTSCNESLPRCSADSTNPGVACITDLDCKGGSGKCEHCQPNCDDPVGGPWPDCDDGVNCNGKEKCVSNRCIAGVPPCGKAADCAEGRCYETGTGTDPIKRCTDDTDCTTKAPLCTANGVPSSCCTGPGTGPLCGCQEETGPYCRMGRCCCPFTDDNGEISPACTHNPLVACTAVTCAGLGQVAQWYAGDEGNLVFQDRLTKCGDNDPKSQVTDAWGCPKYGRGITMHDVANPPVYPVQVGPVSNSPASVPLPQGPGTLLYELGDDYAFTSTTGGNYLGLDVMRWVGGPTTSNRITVDFYDNGNERCTAAGVPLACCSGLKTGSCEPNFIEDIVLSELGLGVGYQVVIFSPELIIPPSGYVVMRAAEDFEANTELLWLSATDTNGVGTNDPNKLWVNKGPTTSFLGSTQGILAMELVGDSKGDPVGSCCDKASGECQDGVLFWICRNNPAKIYNGNGTKCGNCNAGPYAGAISCRRCSNNNAECSSDADCSGGSCDPNSTLGCPGLKVCSGLLTRPCPNGNSDCTGTQGTCIAANVCSNDVSIACVGADNTPCGGGATTCGHAVCSAIPDCASGACCGLPAITAAPPLVSGCTDTSSSACTASGGTFLGFGTSCDADEGFEDGQQDCCVQPQALQCMSGPNNLQACGRCTAGTVGVVCDTKEDCGVGGVCGNPQNLDCGICVGRCSGYSNAGNTPCRTSADCAAGGTCLGAKALNNTVCSNNDATCSTASENGTCVGAAPNGLCNGGLRNGLACASTLDCQGTVCDGKCTSRWSGADDCEDSYVHVISVPDPGSDPVVVTITGTNVNATRTYAHPDSDLGGTVSAMADPGWWEAFSINACARVRLDNCCSVPTRQPQYAGIQDACGPTARGVSTAPDPFYPGQAPYFRGPKYCPNDDNLWQTYGLLAAGTYHHSEFAALEGSHGQYQMHITVDACPVTACCYLECNNAATVCAVDTDCTGGGSCLPKCAPLNQLDCDAKDGFSLQPPQTASPVPACSAGLCDVGSCCTGPDECKDKRDNLNVNMTKARCDQLNGDFKGKILCYGGICVGGDNNGQSCADSIQCENGGVCQGTVTEKAQLSPCPICEIENSFNCQPFNKNTAAYVAYSDLSFGAGLVTADDFIANSGIIDRICTWGSYMHIDPDTADFDCAGTVGADKFRVRIYKDKNGIPDSSPSGIVAERTSGSTVVGKRVISTARAKQDLITAMQAIDLTVEVYAYQLTIDPVVLTAGECYWIEIANNTPDFGATKLCEWGWLRQELAATTGNRYAATGNAFEGYGPGSEVHWDQAFCLNNGFTSGGCGERQKACCSCASVCGIDELESCNADDFEWLVTKNSCDGVTCPGTPSNDNCANARKVPVGTYSYNCGCATTDGFGPIPNEPPFNDNIQLLNDLWYDFTIPNDPNKDDATERCDLMANMCGTGTTSRGNSTFDVVMALYFDAAHPTSCPCPTTAAVDAATRVGTAQDENCYKRAIGGPAFILKKEAKPGECYTIRIGGFPGQGNEAGAGSIDISCGVTFCGDGRTNGTEECDGLDTSRCPDPNSICRAPTLPVGPTGRCTCGSVAVCGNGNLELPKEECDPNCAPGNLGCPASGTGCVLPATCIPGTGDNRCTCAAYCGNNHIETGPVGQSALEDCDGADAAACPGQCSSWDACTVDADCPNVVPLAGRCQGGFCRDCKCPPFVCGNGIVEFGEDCDPGLLPGPGDDVGCDVGPCRMAGDPQKGCTCACSPSTPPPTPIWDPNPLATTRTARSLRFTVVPPATADATAGHAALKVTMVDLQHPNPANLNIYPPKNFTTFDTRSNGVCTGGGLPGHHCDTSANCAGGTCSSLATCTAAGTASLWSAGESVPANATGQGGCARWVGKPGTFMESQGPPSAGPFRSARLQCTPFYFDWVTETAGGTISVVGPEIVPSSEYAVEAYADSCKGAEDGCTDVSPPVTMLTRRSGDVASEFNPPATTDQPNSLDVAALVLKFKGSTSPAHAKANMQLQPNLMELNSDVGALDIVACVDAVKLLAYSFSGPCPCPSQAVCGLACTGGATCTGSVLPGLGAGSMCVFTCTGPGPLAGDPCIGNSHCTGSGTCSTTGSCRDRCGRCK